MTFTVTGNVYLRVMETTGFNAARDNGIDNHANGE